MIYAEALKVERGDWIQFPRAGTFVPGVVLGIETLAIEGIIRFTVRPLASGSNGKALPKSTLHFERCEHFPTGIYWSRSSTETANVFADYLEGQGHLEAADCLRAKFPVAEAGLTEWRGQ